MPVEIKSSAENYEIKLAPKEVEILRKLASEIAEIASLDIHKEKAKLWNKLNRLESERPVVFINQIPWHEMNVNDELTIQTTHPWAREKELEFRKIIYQWKHCPGDMIVSDFLSCPLVIENTKFGITADTDHLKLDSTSDISAQHFNPVIKEPEDIEKIIMPVITFDAAKTEVHYQLMCDLFKGIMPVKKEGIKHIWFTPWDYLIGFWGVQEAMMDLVMRPEMVNAAVSRMVDAWMIELDQLEEMNLLSLNNNNTSVGSGGYGLTDELPGENYDPAYVRPHNMWGCSNAQIFSEVSPEMHWEFAIRHDLRWLERWGMTYYGCCEQLHGKMDLMRQIPNLRKVSASPWCDWQKAAENIGEDYVFSCKPNPAILAEARWRPEQARAELQEVLDVAAGKCHIEFVLKDISTVNYAPRRLWEWAELAMELALENAG